MNKQLNCRCIYLPRAGLNDKLPSVFCWIITINERYTSDLWSKAMEEAKPGYQSQENA
jgi:hypothetical protein